MSESSDPREVPEDAGLAEGGGAGGGSEAVEHERRRVSPLRGPALVFVLILSVIVVLVPVLWIGGFLRVGVSTGPVWATLSVIGLAVAVFVLYFMLRKNI